MLKKILPLIVLLAAAPLSALDLKPAPWHHLLSYAKEAGSAPNVYEISSVIESGTGDQHQAYRLSAKVSEFGKQMESSSSNPDSGISQVFKVTLRQSPNPKELQVDFEHVISYKTTVMHRFAGTTRLPILN